MLFLIVMKEYIQIEFRPVTTALSEMLVAALSEAGFDGFEEGDDSLKAYIPAREFDEKILNEITGEHAISYTKSVIEETNWNAVWESNFQPVLVEDPVSHEPWAGIRAHFHEPMPGLLYEILITPKMSFGTGHHATTYMMMQQMREIDFTGKKVFDFGTGTGVLAILAEKLGAARILATDNDEWSITNTIENLQHNQCSAVEVILMDTVPVTEQFDIILANINKNVILEHLAALVTQLRPGGIILFSGLLTEDETDIMKAIGNTSLQLQKKAVKNNWISLRFSC
jgi:ribosomal protein L11 methyltransferase